MTVQKKDATTHALIDGATFQLWNDLDHSHTLTAGDTTNGTAHGTSGGTYTWTGLGYGDYLVQEVTPPAGYTLPAVTVQAVSITAQNSGTTQTFTFQDPQILSSIKVVKLDAATGAPLAGAIFGLRSTATGTDIATCTTAADGSCTFSGLSFGTYFVVEEHAPTGYDLSSPATQGPITINAANAGTTQTFTFNNPHKRSSLTVKKVDAEGGAPLAGGVFELHSGTSTGALVGSCTTTLPTGTCSIGNLDFGTYVWVETAAPTGYTIPTPAFSDPITIDASNAGGTFPVTTFADPHKLSNIKVQKHDATLNGALIDGATFQLWLDNGDGSFNAASDTKVGGAVSTTGGAYTWSNLDFGVYFVQEVSPPTGYQLPAQPVQKVTITAANAGGTTTVDFADPHKLSNIKVQKHDATLNGALIDGATFQLWLDNGDGSFNAASDTKVGGAVSTTGGAYTWSNLDFGVYFVQEASPPTGYQLPAQPVQKVTITAANAGGTTTVDFADPHKLTDLTVVKQDAVDHSALDGAVFALRNTPAGSNLLTCATSIGSCTFSGLDFGTYYVVEITPPAGYSLPAVTTQGPFTINAANAGQTVTVTFQDPRLPGTVKAHKVDANGGAGLPGAIFELRSGSADGTTVATQSSDGSGNVTFTGVAFGTYFVVEVTPPLGYSLPAVTACGPIAISSANLSDFATCTGEGAFTDAQKPASLSLDKQVQPSGGSTWSAVGLKGSSTAIDLSVDNGTSVVYRYVVVNTGQQTIDGLVVTDDRVSSGDITCLATTLAPGAVHDLQLDAPDGDLPGQEHRQRERHVPDGQRHA